jgi:hypothetical protein
MAQPAIAATYAEAIAAYNAAIDSHDTAAGMRSSADTDWQSAGQMWDEAVAKIAAFVPMNATETEVKAQAQSWVTSGNAAMATGNLSYNLAEARFAQGEGDLMAADGKISAGSQFIADGNPTAAAAAFDDAVTLSNSAKGHYDWAKDKYYLACGLYDASYDLYLLAYNLIVAAINAR